jgi:hypothetical protein
MVIFPSRGVSWQRAGSLKRYKQRNEITYERRPLTKRELEIFMIVMMIDGLLFWRSDTCCNVVYPHLHGVHDFRLFFFVFGGFFLSPGGSIISLITDYSRWRFVTWLHAWLPWNRVYLKVDCVYVTLVDWLGIHDDTCIPLSARTQNCAFCVTIDNSRVRLYGWISSVDDFLQSQC